MVTITGDSFRPINAPNDTLSGGGAPVNAASLLDFWRWAYCDLCDDDVKGVFAEWIVHLLLAVPIGRRVSWANSDVITTKGVRLEVKATAYWQSWKLVDEYGKNIQKPAYDIPRDSEIRFSGLMARTSTKPVTGSSNKDFKSDAYVFAFQNEKDPFKWNAMDLSQWEFYLFSVDNLRKFAGTSISLLKLREQQEAMDAATFSVRGKQLIQDIASR